MKLIENENRNISPVEFAPFLFLSFSNKSLWLQGNHVTDPTLTRLSTKCEPNQAIVWPQ